MKLIILVLITTLNSTYLNSAIYKYHPYSTLSIGGGFNPFNPREKYLKCITHDGLSKRNGPMSTEVEISFVQSTTDLYNKLNFSAMLEGSFLFLEGQTSLNYLSEKKIGKEQLSWIILFRTRFANYELINPTLKEKYQNIKYENLIDICGSEIATEESRTAMIYAMFTFNKLNKREKTLLKNKIGLNAKGSTWNTSLNTSYQKLIESLKFSQDISISINALGGDGVKSLANLIDDGKMANYQALPKTMHDYISNLNENNSVPTSYSTTQLTSFLNQPNDIRKIFNKKNFSKIYNKYIQTEQNLERIRTLLNKKIYTNHNKQEHLQNLEQEHYNFLIELEDAALKCFGQENKCTIPITTMKAFSYIDNSNECENKRETALAQGLIGPEFYLMAQKRNFIPIIKNNKIIEWTPCNL
jgi:hypothetical protein